MYDLVEAFNDCVDRLHAGQSLEDCLSAHPQLADHLRPLLETAMRVHQAQPTIPVGARARVRERVMKSAPRSRPGWSLAPRGLTMVAASVLVAGFVVAMLLLANRDQEPSAWVAPLPTDTLSPIATEAPLPTMTSTNVATVAPSATPMGTATPTPTESQPVTPTAIVTATVTATLTPTSTASATASACVFEVTAASINLRSGPSTGYSVIGNATSGDRLSVIARDTGDQWLQVQSAGRSAWAAASLGTLQGDCANLSVSTPSPVTAPGAGSGAPDDVGDDGDDGGDHDGDDDGDDDGGDDAFDADD